SSTGDTTATVCDSLVWLGSTYYTSGDYEDIIPNAAGCDSTITLHLTVNNSTTGDTTATVCDSLVWLGSTYYTSGDYSDIIPNAAGCDSTITLHLTVNNSSTGDTTATVCDSLVWLGSTYYTSGDYEDIIPNAAGCDSTITLHLTVNNSSSSSITETACFTYNSPSGHVWTTSGTYLDTIPNTTGCDSIISINLTINTVDTIITVSGLTLTANTTGALYQWLDCNNAFAIISGETSQSYTAIANGSYAVELTENSCIDTSYCYLINGVGISDPNKDGIRIYPNPNNGQFIIENLDHYSEIYITDILGKQIFGTEVQSNSVEIDLGTEAKGIYFLNCKSKNAIKTYKIVIE
ncbi:hypothetical protein C0581_04925, partial [Candidatus Parcubacteria bacterium]